MKTIAQRLNNVMGQVAGIKKMVETKKDCVEILTQLKAVRSAISSVMETLVDDQLECCLKEVKSKDKNLLIKMKKYVKTN